MNKSVNASKNQTGCSRREVFFLLLNFSAQSPASRRLNPHVPSGKRVSCEQQLDLPVFEHDQRYVVDGMRTPWKLPLNVAWKNCVGLSSTCLEVPVGALVASLMVVSFQFEII